MIKITKRELDYLLANNVKYGEYGIMSTVGSGKKKTYYVTETPKVKTLLNEIANK